MLTSGSKLGAYEVVAQIGAGGMGEVYSARDTRLNRNVALKVLPEVFAADPDCMARFGCEAKLLAPQISLPPVVDFPENSLSKWIKNTAGPLRVDASLSLSDVYLLSQLAREWASAKAG